MSKSKPKSQTKEILELLTSFIEYSEKQFDRLFKEFDSNHQAHNRYDLELQKVQAQIDGLQAGIEKLETMKEDSLHVDQLEMRIDDLETDMHDIKTKILN